MKSIKELEAELVKATRDVKDLDKQKRSASFKSLSNYSKGLFNEDYQKAVGRQMDILMEMVETGHPETELTKIVKRSTK